MPKVRSYRKNFIAMLEYVTNVAHTRKYLVNCKLESLLSNGPIGRRKNLFLIAEGGWTVI